MNTLTAKPMCFLPSVAVLVICVIWICSQRQDIARLEQQTDLLRNRIAARQAGDLAKDATHENARQQVESTLLRRRSATRIFNNEPVRGMNPTATFKGRSATGKPQA